jgi:hypothetical protein
MIVRIPGSSSTTSTVMGGTGNRDGVVIETLPWNGEDLDGGLGSTKKLRQGPWIRKRYLYQKVRLGAQWGHNPT